MPGSRWTLRLHGIGRLSGRGVREKVLRSSFLPVLVAPAAESNGILTRRQSSGRSFSCPRPHLVRTPDVRSTTVGVVGGLEDEYGNGRGQRGHLPRLRRIIDRGLVVRHRRDEKTFG